MHVKINSVSDLKSMGLIRKLIQSRLELVGVFSPTSVAFPKLPSSSAEIQVSSLVEMELMPKVPHIVQIFFMGRAVQPWHSCPGQG